MKKNHVFTLAAMLIVMVSASVWANPVSPEQARQVASGFLSGKTVVDRVTGKRVPRRAPAQNEMETKVVFDATDSLGQPLMYAVNFKTQGGFVLVSGDDRFNEVLGYSDSEQFDEQNMPENMRAWLQGYVDEMNHLKSINYQPTLRRAPATTKTAVEPLITTKWNQGSPYNNLCPIDTDNKRSITGCMATAMAQVVNYHIQHYNAPTALIADIPAYTTRSHSLHVDAIPAGTAIPDKSLLLDVYDNNATEEQNTAVAQLMLYCGASIGMDYTSSSASGTKATAGPMIDYFGFDTTTRYLKRINFGYIEWLDMVYGELAASRPMYYSGASSGGGHAFVVDGYDGAGMFHVNWGWGGHANGYYALSAMNPNDEGQPGASSSSDGYIIDQHMMIGAQINTGATLPPDETCLRMTANNFRIDEQKVVFGAFNWTGEEHGFDYGIGYLEVSGEITPITYSSVDKMGINYGWSTLSYTVPTNTDYANMTRKVIPIGRVKGTETWCSATNEEKDYFLAEYDADGVPHLTVVQPQPVVDLQASSLSVTSNKFVNTEQTVRVSLTNNGDEYYGTLSLFVSTDETIGKETSYTGVEALPGSTQDIDFYWTPEATGTYKLSVCQYNKEENVLATTSVTITTDPGLDGKKVIVTYITYGGLDEDSWQTDATTGVRTVNIYAEALNSGWMRIENKSDETQEFSFKVYFDRYNETTGEFEIDEQAKAYNSITLAPGGGHSFWANRSDRTQGNTYRVRIARTDVSPEVDLDDHIAIRVLPPGSFVVNPRYTSRMMDGTEDPVRWSIVPSTAEAGTTIDLTHIWSKDSKKIKHIAIVSASNPEGTEATKIADNHWQYTMPAEDVQVKVSYVTEYASLTSVPTAINGLIFNGELQAIINAGEAEGGTLYYSLDMYNWTTTVPVALSGQHTAYYKIIGDANHLDYTPSPNTVDVSITDFAGTGTADAPYLIPSTFAWNHFVNKVNSGTSYEGKHFRQTADINVTTMAGTKVYPFKGIYDGAGYTLTVAYNTTEECTAPFRYIEGATIKNLRTAGTITTSAKFAGSIVGQAKCNNTILNCRAGVAITSTKNGDGTHGGVIGLMQGDNTNNTITAIEGTVFEGKLLGDNTNSCGGFVGWCPTEQQVRLELANNLFAPQEVTLSTASCKTFSRGSDMNLITITNCYYSRTLGSVQGKQMYSITGEDGVSVANAGAATEYSVSGITSYGTGIVYDGVLYGGSGDAISLNLSGSTNYTASAGTITGSSNPHILTMAAANTVIYGDATVTAAPSAKNLTYNGVEQALVNAGTASGGTMNYSLDNSSWSTSIPTATDADDYTVYYKVVGDANHSDYTPSPNTVAVTISKAALSITADNKSVTYGDAAPTYTASYSGFVGSETASVLGGSLAYACEYSAGSNVGGYTITPNGVTASNYDITFNAGTLTVNKADAVITTAPTAVEGLVYTGAAQTLISDGTAMGGELQYKLDDGAYGTSLPQATDADTYTVYYKVIGDANHNDVDEASISVTIAAASASTELKDDEDNTALLSSLNDGNAHDITINRSLSRDGYYNTLCLPFDLDAVAISGSPLEGFVICELTAISVSGDMLYLEMDITDGIDAGKPYLVRYAGAPTTAISPLVFNGVTVTASAGSNQAVTGAVMHGILEPTVLEQNNENVLFLASGNTLKWNGTGSALRGFRAYFSVTGSQSLAPVHRGMPARIIEYHNTPTDIETVTGNPSPVTRKELRNGQLIIIRGWKEYNAQGQTVK